MTRRRDGKGRKQKLYKRKKRQFCLINCWFFLNFTKMKIISLTKKINMARFDFSPIADYVTLKFKCPECGTVNETDAFPVPLPDFTADNHSDSCMSEDYEYECEGCEKVFEIALYNGICGGDGEISDLDDEDLLKVNEEFPDDDMDYEESKSIYFNNHVRDTVEVLNKIDNLDEASRNLLYRTLFANIISSMEAYLSDRLIQKVLSTEKYKRMFTEKFKDFEDERIPLSNLFSMLDKIDSHIQKKLREIIYHNLPRVKNIYKSVLDINLGDISLLMKDVAVRHDIVHRNGKDKDGNMREITKEDVLTLAERVSNFIKNIEDQFMLLELVEHA